MVNILLQTNIIKWRRTLLNTHVTEVSPNGMRAETTQSLRVTSILFLQTVLFLDQVLQT